MVEYDQTKPAPVLPKILEVTYEVVDILEWFDDRGRRRTD